MNWHKSSLSWVGISGEKGRELAAIFGCKWKDCPPSYLGLPLGGNPRSSQFASWCYSNSDTDWHIGR